MNSDLVDLILIAREVADWIHFFTRSEKQKSGRSITRWPCGGVVYVLFDDESVLYIGQSFELGKRLYQHRQKEYKYVMAAGISDTWLREDYEKLMIVSVKTKYNKQADFRFGYFIRSAA